MYAWLTKDSGYEKKAMYEIKLKSTPFEITKFP
jgi:hypothetical protein